MRLDKRFVRVCALAVVSMLGSCAGAERASEVSRDSRAGSTFKDCPSCPQMVVVPSGSFTMGSPQSEQDWSVEKGRARKYTDRESPAHRVTFAKPFSVGVYEVTRKQFAAFAAATGSDGSGASCQVFQVVDGKMTRGDQAGMSWRKVAFEQTDDHPAVCISWHQAQSYVRWLSGQTGFKYRLLTEAEWEYVARAGTQTARHWGDDREDAEICRYANLADTAPLPNGELWERNAPCKDGFWATSPVGRFQPNAFGVYDILGNAWEWVEDCGHDTYVGAPSDGSAWSVTPCTTRAIRGGAFHEGGGYVRAAVRGLAAPEIFYDNSGFRVARDLP